MHEGGIATPFIAHWPAGALHEGRVVRTPFQLTDVLPTILDATGAPYPARYNGRDIMPLEGRSMLPALRGEAAADGTLFWEHTGQRRDPLGAAGSSSAIIRSRGSCTTFRAIAPSCTTSPRSIRTSSRELAREWQRWADRVGVIPWEVTVDIYAARGQPLREAMG